MVRSDSKIEEDWKRKLRERKRREYGKREKRKKRMVRAGEATFLFLFFLLFFYTVTYRITNMISLLPWSLYEYENYFQINYNKNVSCNPRVKFTNKFGSI